MKADGLTWEKRPLLILITSNSPTAFSFKPGGGERHHGAAGALLKIGYPFYTVNPFPPIFTYVYTCKLRSKTLVKLA